MTPNISPRLFSEQAACSNDAVKTYLQQVYEPLVSADGINWRMLPPFDVQFKPGPDEWKEAWLETRLYHFSEVARGKRTLESEGKIGELVPDLSSAKLPTSKYANHSTFTSKPLSMRVWNRNCIILGNATEVGVIWDTVIPRHLEF